MNVSSVKNLNGETFSAVQDASLTNVIQTNSGNWQDITAYQNASATYLTEVSIPESATWNEVSTTVQINSATWGQGGTGGDEEVNSFVYNNSATINEVNTTYQSNSSNYITAHQSLTEYVSKSDTNVAIGVENTSHNSFVQGEHCSASKYSFAQGYSNSADYYSFAQGTNNLATAFYSFAQGTNNTADSQSFAQGSDNIAGYFNAFAQGTDNIAYGHSFAQGTNNTADSQSFAQGYYNSANNASLAQGSNNTAYNVSIAQGIDNYASNKSQAFGNNTRATNNGMAIGTYNNTESAAFVVGNGKNNARSDSFIIFHDGSVSAAGKISANGVELGAGSESFPVSADEAVQYVQTNSANWEGGNTEVESYVVTNSAKIDDTVISYQTNSGTFLTAHQAISAEEWNGCYDNVNTNSGAWGGSALPISAGPGIKFEMVDNTLVASTDETLLWSGNGTSISAFTVSEPLTNFKEIVFNITPNIGDGVVVQKVIVPMVGNNTSALYLVFDSTWDGFTGINFSYKFNNTGMSAFSLSTGAWFGFNNNVATTGNFNTLYGYEIYGVKRIAGGN